MTYLEAINTVLRFIGEYPVDSEDVMYPTVELIKPAIAEQISSLLIQGWWFNTYSRRVLQPDAIGQVAVPSETLACYPVDDNFIWNGSYIARKDGTAPNAAVTVDLVVDMPFAALPITAKRAAVYAAAYTVYMADFGSDQTSQGLQMQAAAYFQALSAQHTRTRKYSTKDRQHYQKYLSALRQ